MKSKLLKLKLELKNLSKSIKIQKSKRCADNNGYIAGLEDLRSRYRHMHVVYCLARGRTLEQCDSGVGLDMDYVNFHVESLANDDKKLYCIVDEKLPIAVQAVQACHAVAEFMKKYPGNTWQNGTFVLLKGNVTQLYKPRYARSCEYAEFKEPDLKNQLTAYCAFGPGMQEYFAKLPLV